MTFLPALSGPPLHHGLRNLLLHARPSACLTSSFLPSFPKFFLDLNTRTNAMDPCIARSGGGGGQKCHVQISSLYLGTGDAKLLRGRRPAHTLLVTTLTTRCEYSREATITPTPATR